MASGLGSPYNIGISLFPHVGHVVFDLYLGFISSI